MCAVVGDKNSFGIEYAVQSKSKYTMGNMRLWLEGRYIGAFDDVNILTSTLMILEILSPEFVDSDEFVGMDSEQIYEHIKADGNYDGDRFYFTPGEAFDDFSIVVYSQGGYFNFIWKLHDDPYFQYPDYPKGIQSAQVSVDEFCKVVTEFKKIILG